MINQGSSLADEIAAELELGLNSAVEKAAGRLKNLRNFANRLKELGLSHLVVDKLSPVNEIKMVGISSANVTIPAFGGLLFGATALAQGMEITGSDITASWEQTQVKVGDIDFYGKDERLRWQQILLAFQLLEEIIEDKKAHFVLIDLPLFVSRREEAVIADDAAIAEEWEHLAKVINEFWDKHLTYIYPFNSEGILLASLRPHSATSLFSALQKNPQSSPDIAGENLAAFLVQESQLCQRLGQSRLLDYTLTPSSRSIAYSYEDLDLDPRWQPSALHQVGILGFFLRARRQTDIWHIQIPGHKTQWKPEKIDWLAKSMIQGTLYDDANSLPLPLWFARKNVGFPRELLMVYREGIEKELAQHVER